MSCNCQKGCNCYRDHDGPAPKFYKGQKVNVRRCLNADITRIFKGTINCVIGMKTHNDYYVEIDSCTKSTIRVCEDCIEAFDSKYNCRCHCVAGDCSCCRCTGKCNCHVKTVPPPKFRVGQRVRTTFKKADPSYDHCGTVVEVVKKGCNNYHCEEGMYWYYKVKMCPNDKSTAIKGGIRYHAESFFEAVDLCCCHRHCGCCKQFAYCCCLTKSIYGC